MFKSYSLGLIGWTPYSLEQATTSQQMLCAGLSVGFRQLKHVNLFNFPLTWETQKNATELFKIVPNLDFILIHCGTRYSPVVDIKKIRSKVKFQICSFIEHPQRGMDFTFGYLKSKNPDCYIPFPYCKEFMINKQKTPKTILLNDSIYIEHDIAKKIGEWLSPLLSEGYTVYQLIKKSGKLRTTVFQEYVKHIDMCEYGKYMEKTEFMETFIQTHPGTYEHSILDMAGRGVKTLIPSNQLESNNAAPFIPQEMIDGLQLSTFTSQKELLNLIRTPLTTSSKINKMTEMCDVVKIIDGHFQKVLGNS